MAISKQSNSMKNQMVKICKIAYLTRKSVRLTTWATLLIVSMLFFWLTGGFPPRGWRVLAQALSHLSELWALRGLAVIPPLFALMAYSFTLLLIWCALIGIAVWAIVQQWFYLRTWRRIEEFARSVQRADAIKHPLPAQQPWAEPTVAMPVPAPAPVVPIQTATKAAQTARNVNLYPPMAPALQTALKFQTQPLASTVPQNGASTTGTTSTTSPTSPTSFTSPISTINTMNTAVSSAKATKVAVQPTTDPLQKQTESFGILRVGTKLDPGITRKQKPNEDHLLAVHGTHTFNTDYRPYGLFVVADGMGGHANGQEASRLAIQHIRNTIIPTLMSNVDLDSKHCKELLLEGIQHANLAIYQQNRLQGCDMGSTITAAILVGSLLTIANVGDSRTYLYRESTGLKQVTHDHSMVARMVEKGIISADEVYTHPQRNQIYRCLGETASVLIDTFSLPYKSGDTLLLCSDGLWEMVRDTRIQDILRGTLPDAPMTTQELVQAALEGGGKDNISAIVVYRV